MAALPLISNFEGDFLLQLFQVDTENTMDQVAVAAAHHSLGRRVANREGKVLRVRKQDATDCFPRAMKVKDAGLEATECVWIVFADR